jgi:dTDP-4-amino-4,6-dideoxygalactose transaminase
MAMVQPQPVRKGYRHAYGLYTIKVSAGSRDKLLAYLNANDVESRVYYPVPLHEMKAFKAAKVSGELKAVEDVKKRVLSIPMHPFLKDNEIDYIIKTIRAFFKT